MTWNCIYFLTCMVNFFPLGGCKPVVLIRKKSMVKKSEVLHEIQLKCESSHYENYLIDNTNLGTWPELTSETEEMYCDKYTKLLFTEKAKRMVVSANSVKVLLHYEKVVAERVPLVCLQCKISPAFSQRRYIHFIRSAQPDCVYLIRRRLHNSFHFIISEEICLNRKYNFRYVCDGLPGDRNQVHEFIGRMRTARYVNDVPKKLEEYEDNHYQHYMSNADHYVKWPEIKDKNAEKLCRLLLNEVIPKTPFSELIIDKHLVPLQYTQRRNTMLILRVSALRCQLFGKVQRSCFQFIKAPLTGCVHMIKQINSQTSLFRITKLICVVDILPQPTELSENARVTQYQTFPELHDITIEPLEKDNTKQALKKPKLGDSSTVNHAS